MFTFSTMNIDVISILFTGVASAAHTSGSLQQTSIKHYLQVDQPASYTDALEGLQSKSILLWENLS